MSSEKCSHCGHVFEPVWFQREDLRVRRDRHESRCIAKSPAERDYYRRHGRWQLAEVKRRKERGRGKTAATPKRPAPRPLAATVKAKPSDSAARLGRTPRPTA